MFLLISCLRSRFRDVLVISCSMMSFSRVCLSVVDNVGLLTGVALYLYRLYVIGDVVALIV